METTRSIVWLAKKSKTETVADDVWGRAPGTRSLGIEAKDPAVSLEWQFFMPSRNRITTQIIDVGGVRAEQVLTLTERTKYIDCFISKNYKTKVIC